MGIFRHFEPLQWSGDDLLPPARGIADEPNALGESVRQMWSVGSAALLLYRGIYTLDTEYLFVAAEGTPLDWYPKYWEDTLDSESLVPKPIQQEEIAAIVSDIKVVASEPRSSFPFEPATLLSDRANTSVQLTTQYLAVETLLCLDEALELFISGRGGEALPWFGQAHLNLNFAGAQVRHIVYGLSTNARSAARARHREDDQNGEAIMKWYAANADKFPSLDKAAEAAARTIAPVSFRTARKYVGRAARALRSARRP